MVPQGSGSITTGLPPVSFRCIVARRPRPRPLTLPALPSHRVDVRAHLATAAGIVIAGCYGLFVARVHSPVAMAWPASAVALTAVLLGGRGLLPTVGLATSTVALIDGRSIVVALVMGIPAVAEAAVAAGLAQRTRLDLGFRRVTSPLHLAGIALVAALVGAALGVGGLVAIDGLPAREAMVAAAAWALGDAVGMVAFAPALLLVLQPRQEPARPAHREFALLGTLVALVCAFVLVTWAYRESVRTVPMLIALFPIVTWTSLRVDMRRAAIIVVILSVAGTVGVKLHTGALVSVSDAREVLNVQVFHVLVVLMVLAGAASTAERETALARSREAEQRFAAVSEAATDVQMLFRVSPGAGLHLVHLNRAAREALAVLWPGVPQEGLLGRSTTEIIGSLPGFSAGMLERNLAFGREAIARREVVRYEDEVHTAAGTRVAEVTITPIFGADGTPTHVLRSSVDISSRKATEASTRRFHEDLEHRVAERTHQLAIANRELAAFGYSLSHDLKAPLRAIEGFGRAIIEDLDQGTASDLRDHAQRILTAAARMRALVDDLLRLSQLPTGDLARTSIDLTALAGDIVQGLRDAEPARQVTVAIQPALTVRADARLLAIALENLLANAWKYTGRRADARIEVGQITQRDEVVTYVRDNGVGFDMRFAGRLFSPFERLHKAEEFEGAGIGLATVRRIVTAHGGRIWAESTPGQGATFSFTLEHPGPATASPA